MENKLRFYIKKIEQMLEDGKGLNEIVDLIFEDSYLRKESLKTIFREMQNSEHER